MLSPLTEAMSTVGLRIYVDQMSVLPAVADRLADKVRVRGGAAAWAGRVTCEGCWLPCYCCCPAGPHAHAHCLLRLRRYHANKHCCGRASLLALVSFTFVRPGI